MADEIKSLVVRYDGTINEFKDNVLYSDGSIKDAEFRNKVVFIYGSRDDVTTDNLIQSIWVSDNDNGKFFDLTNIGNITGALNYINGLRTYGIPINDTNPQTYEADLQGGQGLLLKGINGINVRFNPNNTDPSSDASGTEYWTIEIGLGNDIYNAETGKINESLLPDYILGQLMFGGTIENRREVSIETNEPEIYIKPTKSFIDKFGFEPDTVDILVTPSNFNAADFEGVYFIAKRPEGGGATNNMIYPVKWQGVTYDYGDWFLSNGVEWVKIDNTDAVTEVAGLRGNITAENLITKLTDEELPDRLVTLNEISAMISVKVITPSN
jgi:hypothetical protein